MFDKKKQKNKKYSEKSDVGLLVLWTFYSSFSNVIANNNQKDIPKIYSAELKKLINEFLDKNYEKRPLFSRYLISKKRKKNYRVLTCLMMLNIK